MGRPPWQEPTLPDPYGVSRSGPGAWGGGPPACCTALWVCGLPACQALNQDYTKSFWSELGSLLKKNELLAKNTREGLAQGAVWANGVDSPPGLSPPGLSPRKLPGAAMSPNPT